MEAKARFVPIVVLCLVIACIGLIPLKVIGYGFLPEDDALRHAAKAVSEKSWDEILVLSSEVKTDNHPGWHAILGLLHRIAGWQTDALVVFSVVVLFLLFCLAPVFFLDRPESWPATLLVLFMAHTSFITRLFYGRPYIISMFTVLVLCFVWPKLKSKEFPYKTIILITSLVALSTWAHGSSHLFMLPLVSFFLAREWRAGFFVAVSITCGVILGAVFTGSPYLFLKQSIDHVFLAFGGHPLTRMLVSEFQPSVGDSLVVGVVLGILAWRQMRGAWNRKVIDNPVFILAICGWVMGFVVVRLWFDWGMPALCVWMACEFQEAFEGIAGYFSWKRILLTLAVVTTLYLAATNDVYGRWTSNLTREYLSTETAEQASWLPSPGGVIYSDDMTIFYQTFFKNPHAPWRYMLGFEPAIMPPEDLAIFRRIQWNNGAYQSFEPWVKKMKPADRLIIRRPWNQAPNIPGLEWHYAASGIWIGRPPKK